MNSISFAYKFSKFKSKVVLLIWIVILSLALFLSVPYVTTYNSIKSLSDHFVKVEILDESVKYTIVNERPDQWVDLKNISKRLQWAIIVSEDGKFFQHEGFDYEQYQNAFKSSFVQKKKKVRGASTITQQLIKNLFLNRERSIFRKLKEFIFSLIIEKSLDKNKILETYLNVIEYGKNIYGIKSAAYFYFKKNPQQLTARESAFLAMLLPSPVKYSKSFKNKVLSPFALRIINSILIKMNQAGAISMDELQNQSTSVFFWELAPNPNPNQESQSRVVEDEIDGEVIDE